MEKNFKILHEHFGNHRAASKACGISYPRWNHYRKYPETAPPYIRKNLELAVTVIRLQKAAKFFDVEMILPPDPFKTY